MPEYLIILVFLLLLAIFLHKYFHLRLYKSNTQAIIANIVLYTVGIIWDQFAVWRGHWSFNGRYMTGVTIGYMPIEEFLFIFIVIYFTVVIYKLTEKFLQ